MSSPMYSRRTTHSCWYWCWCALLGDRIWRGCVANVDQPAQSNRLACHRPRSSSVLLGWATKSPGTSKDSHPASTSMHAPCCPPSDSPSLLIGAGPAAQCIIIVMRSLHSAETRVRLPLRLLPQCVRVCRHPARLTSIVRGPFASSFAHDRRRSLLKRLTEAGG